MIVKPETDEVYFTPIYYTLSHFSKFIRPNAKRIGFTNTDKELMVTAAKNLDGSIAVVVFNQGEEIKNFSINLESHKVNVKISSQAIQTIVIQTKK